LKVVIEDTDGGRGIAMRAKGLERGVIVHGNRSGEGNRSGDGGFGMPMGERRKRRLFTRHRNKNVIRAEHFEHMNQRSDLQQRASTWKSNSALNGCRAASAKCGRWWMNFAERRPQIA